MHDGAACEAPVLAGAINTAVLMSGPADGRRCFLTYRESKLLRVSVVVLRNSCHLGDDKTVVMEDSDLGYHAALHIHDSLGES